MMTRSFPVVDDMMMTQSISAFGDAIMASCIGLLMSQTGIAADVWRFYLALVRPENQDSAFRYIV
jgi:methionyl-tRNA synthetase